MTRSCDRIKYYQMSLAIRVRICHNLSRIRCRILRRTRIVNAYVS